MNIYIYIYIYIYISAIHLNSNTKLNLKWKKNPKEIQKKGACLPRQCWQTLWTGLRYQPGLKVLICPSCLTRAKRGVPFVLPWRSRLGNLDKRGFPIGTNRLFCSSGHISLLLEYIYVCVYAYASINFYNFQIKSNLFIKMNRHFHHDMLNKSLVEA
jgi:hypothetical protein